MKAIIFWLKYIFYSNASFKTSQKYSELIKKYESMSPEEIMKIIDEKLNIGRDEPKTLQRLCINIEKHSSIDVRRDEYLDNLVVNNHVIDVTGPHKKEIIKSRKAAVITYLLIEWRISGQFEGEKKVIYKTTFMKK